MRRNRATVPSALLLLVMACGGDERTGGELAPADSPVATVPTPAAPDTAITVPFQQVDGLTGSGNVRVEADGSRTLITVLLRTTGAGTWHGNIHEGRCDPPGGSIERLEPVVTDVTGAGEALTAVDLSITMLLDGAHTVMYGDGRSPPSLCAELPRL